MKVDERQVSHLPCGRYLRLGVLVGKDVLRIGKSHAMVSSGANLGHYHGRKARHNLRSEEGAANTVEDSNTSQSGSKNKQSGYKGNED